VFSRPYPIYVPNWLSLHRLTAEEVRQRPRATLARALDSALDYLQAAPEAESIYIFREVVAECEKPVMLYSVGKDSSVMLHLALKAFAPARPPFPLLQDRIGLGFSRNARVSRRHRREIRFGFSA